MEKINPILLIRREMNKKRMPAVALAKKLGLHPSTVKTMLHCSSLQVERLQEISEILQYNFFREMAAALPLAEPKAEAVALPDSVEISKDERIKELEMEVKILRQTLKEVVGKG